MPQSIPLNIIIIILCCSALWKGACWLVDAAARIARWLGISDLVIGLTVIAFGTSAPEFAVTINAALRGMEEISVGNVVGSNIFNIGFILGGCAIVGALKTKREMVWRDGLLLLLVTAVLFALTIDGRLNRLEGACLFLTLIAYLFYLFRQRQTVIEEKLPEGKASPRDALLLLLGLALIITGGHFLVESATIIARKAQLPDLVISLTVVAAGTSVPEFAISLVAILKKHYGISAGNLIGSNLFNTLGVLGVAAALRPLALDSSAVQMIILLIPLTALVIVFMRTGWRIVRTEGIILVLICLALWIYIIVQGLKNASAATI